MRTDRLSYEKEGADGGEKRNAERIPERHVVRIGPNTGVGVEVEVELALVVSRTKGVFDNQQARKKGRAQR